MTRYNFLFYLVNSTIDSYLNQYGLKQVQDTYVNISKLTFLPNWNLILCNHGNCIPMANYYHSQPTFDILYVLRIDLHVRLRDITNKFFVYRHMHTTLSNYEYHFSFLQFFNLFSYTYVVFYSTDTLHFTRRKK